MYKASYLAQQIGAKLWGNPDEDITYIEALDLSCHASAQGAITFMANERYVHLLEKTKASLVLLREEHRHACPVDCLVVEDPQLAYATLSQLFGQAAPKVSQTDIHASAVIANDVTIGDRVVIAANVVIESGVCIGDDVAIGAGSFIGANVTIGSDSLIYPNVNLYYQVILGHSCIIHSGAVIGSDGFGFAKSKQQWIKIKQLGSVHLGNHVEVGANSCIDCGAIGDTVLSDGVKLDNLVHLAHNVHVGENTAIAAGVAIAGSTHVGARCTLAGMVGIADHLVITDDVHITGRTMVARSIKRSGVYSSGTYADDNDKWRKNTIRFKQLDQMYRDIKILKKNKGKNYDT